MGIPEITTAAKQAVSINPRYFISLKGILKIVQLVLGVIALGLAAHNSIVNWSTNAQHPLDLYLKVDPRWMVFVAVSSTFLIMTALSLINFLLNKEIEEAVSHTLVEIIQYGVGFILYFGASIALLVAAQELKTEGSTREIVLAMKKAKDSLIASSVIGLLNSKCHLAHLITSIIKLPPTAPN